MENLSKMFELQTPLLEIFIRGTCIYLSIFLMLRFMKRLTGDFNLTDLLVIVLIADAAQNGMAGDYHTITDGLLLVLTIILWDYALDWLSYKFTFFRWLVHPNPIIVIKHGKMIRANMRHNLISQQELMTQLREQGIEHIHKVKKAFLESDGSLSIIKYDDSDLQKKKDKPV